MEKKYVVCYSGGHISALVAIEAVRKYGKDNVILLNHDISSSVEHQDIKRFKNEVADYLGIDITYANRENYEELDPINMSLDVGAFSVYGNPALCTYYLKTKPFEDWLKENYPSGGLDKPNNEIVILYGFDKDEIARIQRRSSILGQKGYHTDYPLALWDRTINSTEEIGIKRPVTYEHYKHANCTGCLKAGKQHWFIVYCTRPDIFERAKQAEDIIGHSIIKGVYMSELEVQFKEMVRRGITPTEKMKPQTFWAMVRKELKEDESLPCDCHEK